MTPTKTLLTVPASLDAVASQLASTSPERLYREADELDRVNGRLGEMTDQFRSVMRRVEESWVRFEAGGAPPALGETSAAVLRLLGELRAEDAGGHLRRAGDSLVRARTEVLALQQQRAQDRATTGGRAGPDHYDEQAQVVLNRVSRDFVEVGVALHDLPRVVPGGAGVASVAPPAVTTPPVVMALAGSPLMADDVSPSVIRKDLPGGGGTPGLSALASSLPDAPNSNPAGGGQPMMPFMPMGMGGMGATGAPSGSRERLPQSQGTAEADAWREPHDGWEVVGRGGPPVPPGARTEQQADAAIEALLRRRESQLDRGDRE